MHPAMVAALAGLLLLTGGCGFRPVYGEHSGVGGVDVGTQLSLVEIAPIPDRTGQKLRNQLIDRFYRENRPASPSHRLNVTLQFTESETGIRKNEIATSAQLAITARYTLLDAGTNRTALQGVARSLVSYNLLNAPFATVASQQNAYDRGLSQIATDIQTRLELYFSQEPKAAAAPVAPTS